MSNNNFNKKIYKKNYKILILMTFYHIELKKMSKFKLLEQNRIKKSFNQQFVINKEEI